MCRANAPSLSRAATRSTGGMFLHQGGEVNSISAARNNRS